MVKDMVFIAIEDYHDQIMFSTGSCEGHVIMIESILLMGL